MVSLLRKLFKPSRSASGAHNDNPPAYESLEEKHVPSAAENKKAAVDDHEASSKTTTPSSEDKKPTVENKQQRMEQLRRHVKYGMRLSEKQQWDARYLVNDCNAVAGNPVPYITREGYFIQWSTSGICRWQLPLPPPPISPGSCETTGVGLSWNPSFQNLSATPLRTWEIEHMIQPKRDWTPHWGWYLYISAGPGPASSGPDWSVFIHMMFEDLPLHLNQGGVSWGGSLAAVQVGKLVDRRDRVVPDYRKVWQQAHQFVRRSDVRSHAGADGVSAGAADISWAARVFVNQEKKAWFDGGDFRRLLKPEHIQGAELYQRTQRGRCKKVLV
ncbi:hypothetical protein GE09DRAFT_626141 [Coniochaeta sp. 2T2.1]|nr:hypothetical protein GE09DRAFT_626141 [Coniochaeta sp. 2T2.1]